METNTIELLKKYDKNIKSLNISNKNIKDVLDLTNFNNLEELDCSNNEITSIICMSDLLYRRLMNTNDKLFFRHPKITYINCCKNKIKHFEIFLKI